MERDKGEKKRKRSLTGKYLQRQMGWMMEEKENKREEREKLMGVLGK